MAKHRWVQYSLLILFCSAIASEASAKQQLDCRTFLDHESIADEFKPCFYMGLGLGTSYLNPDENSSDFVETKNSDFGYKVYTGYHFFESWFAELMWSEIGEMSFINLNPNLGEAEISYQVPALYLGYYVPVDEWVGKELLFNTFAKLGVSVVNTSSDNDFLNLDENQNKLALGVGFELPFAEKWMVRAEIESFSEDANFASLSLGYWLREDSKLLQNDQVGDDDGSCVSVLYSDSHNCEKLEELFGQISFSLDSSTLSDDMLPTLDKVVATLQDGSGLYLEIEGHGDSSTFSEENSELSNMRALKVKNYIESQGIEEERLIVSPMATRNKNLKISSDNNRRVVLRVYR